VKEDLEKRVNRFWKNNKTMLINLVKKVLVVICLTLSSISLKAQVSTAIMDYMSPEDYIIGGVVVSGVKYLDSNVLIGISGLRVGDEITVPGEAVTSAVKKLYEQGLFSDIKISIDTVIDNKAFFNIFLQERPRLSSVKFFGLKDSETKTILEKLTLPSGTQVTAYVLNNTKKTIIDYWVDKGFLNTTVNIVQKDDPDQPNNVILNIYVEKNDKVKISEIRFEGNQFFDNNRLRRVMKNTKKKNLNFFKPSKYITEKYTEDKASLVTFYNESGFRDFSIISDSIKKVSEDRIALVIKVNEGDQYYLRNIDWIGNSIYSKEQLNYAFGINKGEIYNQTHISDRLTVDEDAVNSLYLDYGYLFSQIEPVEAKIEGDSIDLEVRIYEGDQAYLNDVIIEGNTRTNEHVPRRELYTLPGELFSKSNIMRSVRQLGVLGHFDPEKINPEPIMNQANGTVDLLYKLEEKANDQFEVSGGWGANMLVGTIGVSFNNFSMRNFFNLKEWRPYPSGDGQSISIRAQSNGRYYQSYNISFSEPWLGGKNPNTLTLSMYRSMMTNGNKKGEGRTSMIIDGATAGLGKRLKWPDDYFSLYGELNYQRYDLNNYSSTPFSFSDGQSNLFSFTTRLTRFSTGPNMIYPKGGSSFSLSLQITPPYSLITGKNMVGATDAVKYKWIEFHKWLFKGDYYYALSRDEKLVINAKVAFGYLGHYNNDIGPSPFEYFYVGGDGMTGYSFYGREVIALRGYEEGSVTPLKPGTNAPSGNVYSKLTFELRYPISLASSATIYGLAFVESGKAWYELKEYNPFKMHRSAGIGLRANLPMFGLLGVDWGYGFDAVPGYPEANKKRFSFTMGQQF
jgi:outer membrane protein insertion porin family